jgi:Uma2 family endonuclease
MTGTTDRHNSTALNLAILLRQHLRGGPCQVYISDVMVRVEAADAGFYPDLMVTCAEADTADRYVKRQPLLLVEVLSESTAAYDLGEKFAAYRRLPGLREYVLVDPERPRVQVFRPGADGHWVLYPFGPDEALRLDSIDLEVPVAALYEP